MNDIKCDINNIGQLAEDIFSITADTSKPPAISIQIDLENKTKQDIINSLKNTLNKQETIDGEQYKPTKIISNGIKITEESVDKNKDNNENNKNNNENLNEDDNNKKTFPGFFKDLFDKILTCCSCNSGNADERNEMMNLQNSKEGTKKCLNNSSIV